MIIVALLIGVFGTFISFVYIKNIPLRAILTTLGLVILFGSTWASIANDNSHFMMDKKTTTTNRRIYATQSKSGLNLMVYQNLGTQKKHDVQTYKKTADQKTPSHTQVDEFTTNKIKYVSGNHATLKTTTTNWEFTKAGKFWFGANNWKLGNDKSDFKLVKRVNTFSIPKSWIHLSKNQAQQLAKQMKKSQTSTKQQQAMIKQQGQAFVQAKLKAALTQNPKLATDKAAQQKLAKQAAAEFKQQLVQKQTAQLKKTVKTFKE
ncbi:DUF4811 domain-containing protein [Nicoliella spurrieriana]|uniref:DUF4811 domain-containing protein n=1 Tax=Nicoliella spurrieriana TaxID=2925830 RepID=A0A976RT03_9LACO|nr:DUF4811 domain-containing protein [Nicoliella spurrieriana]UQS87281.1 DUF4811 domain-containing protein [Nicoliella spurrieriana]